jgi:hypothetical protein
MKTEYMAELTARRRPLRREEVIDVWMFDDRFDARESVESKEGLGERADEVCAERSATA